MGRSYSQIASACSATMDQSCTQFLDAIAQIDPDTQGMSIIAGLCEFMTTATPADVRDLSDDRLSVLIELTHVGLKEVINRHAARLAASKN